MRATLGTATVCMAAMTVALSGIADASPTPKVAATVFTVNTNEDSDLASTNAKTCVDLATGACSLRAAVDAANNLAEPVTIKVPSGTYAISGGALKVTNPTGTSVVGVSSTATTIEGADTDSIFDVDATGSGDSAPDFELTGVSLIDGVASQGGAIYLGKTSSGATAVLTDDSLSDNRATSAGGAIYAADYDSLYLDDSTIDNNEAPSGAGLDGYWLDGQFIDSHIDRNFTTPATTGYGGGIATRYGVIDMTGGSISHNTAGDSSDPGYGGGIYDTTSTSYNFADVAINGDIASDGGDGGGLLLESDQLVASGGSISNDTAAGTGGSGGGIFLKDGSQTALHGVNLSNDTVVGSAAVAAGGGAIYDSANATANSLSIDDHSTISSSDNSAVDIVGDATGAEVTISDSTLSKNTNDSQNVMAQMATECGSAVCAYAEGGGNVDLTMDGDTVTQDATTGSNLPAGAIGLFNPASSAVAGHFSDDIFSGNSAGAGGAGGAISTYTAADHSATVTTTDDRFDDNTAGTVTAGDDGDGGAIYLVGKATYSDVGSVFSGNQALGSGSDGGAIYNVGGASDSYSGTRFTGNSVDGNSGDGGAVYDDETAGTRFNHVAMAGNSAADGGGFYGADAEFDVSFDNATVSSNTAGTTSTAGVGGGIDETNGALSLTNTTVADNVALSSTSPSAPGAGGGIWQSGSSLDLRYSTISANTAVTGGGLDDGGSGSLLASIVSGNSDGNGTESDCYGGFVSLSSVGENVLGQASCVDETKSSDVVTQNAGLEPLTSKGGPTKTEELTASSPARGRGGFDCPTADERGQVRGSECDAGAYQFAAGSVTKLSVAKGKAGTKVTITGSGFTFARTVDFGSKAAKFTKVSNTKLTVIVPSIGKVEKATKVTVRVSSYDGSTKTKTFTYDR